MEIPVDLYDKEEVWESQTGIMAWEQWILP